MRKHRTRDLTLLAIMTAVVVLVQYLGSFIHFGQFSISLVLVPIVVGAALIGPWAGLWLGLVFSVIVLFMDSAAFMAVSPVGTIITVLVKGMAAGYLSGLVFRALEGKNRYTATLVSAVVCPLANTGIFLLGCVLFFLPTIREWGLANGFDNVFKYMMIGFVGLNFVFELLVNVILSPVIVRLIDYARKRRA